MSAAGRVDALAHYRTQFDAFRQSRRDAMDARLAAFTRFEQLGFPDARDEAWKYTSLRRLQGRAFAAAGRTTALAPDVPGIADRGLPRVVLVNGYLHTGLSSVLHTSSALRLRVASGAANDPAIAERAARIPDGGGTERFAALNAALAGDPVLVDVERQDDSPPPLLHVLCLATGEEAEMSHPRLSVRLGAGARLTLLLEYHGDDVAERWVNPVVDLELASGAELRLCRLQRQGARTFQTERIDVAVAADARVIVHDASLGATLARLDLHVSLDAHGAAAEVSGLFVAESSRHLDTHVRVDHRAAHTSSVQDYRGIAAERGRGVFNTKVVVHAGAQKTNARQSSRNLLLTPGAEIDTKPELEIYANDVQCGHGATTGQLDPAALFYLRSRGLSFGDARRVLTRAFAAGVLSRMDLAAYSAAVHDVLDSRLDRLVESVA